MSDDARKRLPPGSPCTNCGKCCTNANFMAWMIATRADVRRWKRQKRADILRFVTLVPPGSMLSGGEPVYALLFSGGERRCPFVRKVRGERRYLCGIYETRPQVCRDYEPWSGEPNDVCEIVESGA